MNQKQINEKMIRRCIELSERSLQKGEKPFGSLIAKGEKIIVESEDKTRKNNDITAHAEIMCIRELQNKIKSIDISEYTIYSNCEPCAMCSFMIREVRFGRIVFGVYSKIMGGYSRFKILQDKKLETLPLYYTTPPLIIGGVLEKEAAQTFDKHEEMKKRQGLL